MKTIKIGAHTIGVLFQHDLMVDDEIVSAYYDHNQKAITVNTTLWKDMAITTRNWVILHEVCEAVKAIFSINLAHDDLDRFAEGIADFYQNNPTLEQYTTDGE